MCWIIYKLTLKTLKSLMCKKSDLVFVKLKSSTQQMILAFHCFPGCVLCIFTCRLKTRISKLTSKLHSMLV